MDKNLLEEIEREIEGIKLADRDEIERHPNHIVEAIRILKNRLEKQDKLIHRMKEESWENYTEDYLCDFGTFGI